MPRRFWEIGRRCTVAALICCGALALVRTGCGRIDRVGDEIGRLKSPDINERRDAISGPWLVPSLADDAADATITRMFDKLGRAFGSKHQGNTIDVRVVEPLIVALKDPDSGVRQRAARALGKIGRFASQRRSWDTDLEVREAEAVGKITTTKAVEPLIVALGDEDSKVRQNAAKALGEIAATSAVEPLVAALKDKDSEVRQGAASALGEIRDPSAIMPLLAALPGPEEDDAFYGALVRMGIPVVEPLLGALKDSDPKIRKGAASGLGTFTYAYKYRDLFGRYYDFTFDVRAAEALSRVTKASAVEPLVTALGDEDSGVRQSAASALGGTEDPRAVDPLLVALKDPDSGVRQRAADALGHINDPRVVEPLIAALKDPDRGVRGGTARVLSRIKDPRAAYGLQAALKQEATADFYIPLIERGDGGSVVTLIEVLDESGNSKMAEDFLNCGNRKLANAAQKWATRNGYKIQQKSGSDHGASWGSPQ